MTPEQKAHKWAEEGYTVVDLEVMKEYQAMLKALQSK